MRTTLIAAATVSAGVMIATAASAQTFSPAFRAEWQRTCGPAIEALIVAYKNDNVGPPLDEGRFIRMRQGEDHGYVEYWDRATLNENIEINERRKIESRAVTRKATANLMYAHAEANLCSLRLGLRYLQQREAAAQQAQQQQAQQAREAAERARLEQIARQRQLEEQNRARQLRDIQETERMKLEREAQEEREHQEAARLEAEEAAANKARAAREAEKRRKEKEAEEKEKEPFQARNVSSCLRLMNDNESGTYGGFVNPCDFHVYFTYCVIQPYKGSFATTANCEGQVGGLDGVQANSRQAAFTNAAQKVYWFACNAPSVPKVSYQVGRGLYGQCQ